MVTGVKSAKKRFAIIDGKSVFYRGYYAMPNLSTKDGTPTGGVYGFAVMALEIIKRLDPDYVCVAWDKPKTNIRKRLKMYPAYKAGRKPPPPDFYEQIPILHDLLDSFGWPLYELDDYEADDIMGTLASQAAKKGIETFLITSDLDVLQLVDPHIHAYTLKKGLSNIELYSPETFEAKYGIKPTQFLDLKALKGDSSDNIPGAPGIGEKTAIELLKEHKTLDSVYENLDLIKETTRKKLEAGRESVFLSKKIAAIWTDAPIKLDLKEVDGSSCDPNALHKKLQELEFRTLARQLPDIMKVTIDETTQVISGTSLQAEKIDLIESSEGLKKINIDPRKPLLVHAYCKGASGQDPEYIIFSQGKSNSWIVRCNAFGDTAIGEFLRNLQDAFFAGYDVKNFFKTALSLGVGLTNVDHDILVAGYLIDSIKRAQTLTELAQTELGYEGPELDDLSPEEFLQNAGLIVSALWQLHLKQQKQLADYPKIKKLAQDIEWPLTKVLAGMEHHGIAMDVTYMKKFDEELKDMLSDIEQQIFGHANQEFNISSPSQLAEILFEKLQLPTQGIKKGKTGYSTAASELDKLRGVHPVINLITQYREVSKLMNTYVEPLPTMVDEKNRLHTTYNLVAAPTGRLSSEKPNLQNIPIRSDLGRKIRQAFAAEKGKVLISADYSQIELRVAALLSGDKEMIDLFNRDVDIHTATAAQVYGREPEDVTKNMRRDAKVINFGILYGMSPHGLSVATGMTIVAAKEFIDKYFELRAPLLKYLKELKELAHEQGYVETYFGRRRPTPDAKSANFIVRQAAERAAINMPIQGTAADIMKMAMIDLFNLLQKKDGVNMLLQIHDSVLVECPEDQADDVAKQIKSTMEKTCKLGVKLTTETSIGKNWGEV